jgi:cytochrome c oxidase cbb3-type subunit III
MRRVGTVVAICAVGLLGGCGHAPGYPPNPILRPSEVTDFSTLYKQNCAACHGANGQNGPAMDLANPEYQALVDDATLRKWISGGMPGTEMPAFARSKGGMLTDAQVNALIAGMRKEWLRPHVFGAATPPAYAQTQAGDAPRGQSSYQERCAGCHEPTHQQITSTDYLALVGDQALRTIIVAGRPDIGQPDWRHDSAKGDEAAPLTAQQVDDIVSYLASLRNGAGQAAANVAAENDANSRPKGGWVR